SEFSDREPVIIKLVDESLLCITQKGDDFRFFKTSDGYAESGWRGGIEFADLKAGIDYDTSHANIYYEISPLEALAMVDYDFRKLYEPAIAQAERIENCANPTALGSMLEWIATGYTKHVGPEFECIPDWYSYATDAVMGFRFRPPDSNPEKFEREDLELFLFGGVDDITKSEERIPIVLRLSDGCLIKVSEVNLEDSSGGVVFCRTASGYGVEGLGGSFLVLEGGRERPTAGIYEKISVREAGVLLDDNWHPLYFRAKLQDAIMNDFSTNPEKIRTAFENIYGPSGLPSEPDGNAFVSAIGAGSVELPAEWQNWDDYEFNRFIAIWYWSDRFEKSLH
ncbi:MAG: hypothetical protein KDD53_05860, partial [Bdellovibrionales bacterium]|nr:hypothetical protein [Bdellovibrionales bacterium]